MNLIQYSENKYIRKNNGINWNYIGNKKTGSIDPVIYKPLKLSLKLPRQSLLRKELLRTAERIILQLRLQ